MELVITGSNNKVSVSDAVFGRDFSEDLVHQVVVAYRNAGRAGTKAQKTRSEVAGTTKKSKKQKGGGARHGALTAPIFVGGGVTFAAKPRSFEQKVNRKQYRAAMCAILSELNRQGRLTIVESFDVEATNTKALIAKLAGLEVGKRPLIVTEEASEHLYLSARNIPYVEVRDVQGLDPVSLVGADTVVITADAVKKVEDVLLAPRVSEKTARLQELSNQYVFEISNEATKADVKAAVEQLFDVKVEAVNVVNVKGKNKSFRNRAGRRGDWRKAYVRLADGQSIDVTAKA
uniref:Large ribosomal subunit protein uL23c n=2 Tax=cellular organisms TaxID=131567 RepID=A0AA38XB27_9EURO|nr:hypothetical protein H2204_015501 [Knufia peltigerae]